MSFFQEVKKDIRKDERQDRIRDPLIWSNCNNNPEIAIVTDKYLSKRDCQKFYEVYIEKNYGYKKITFLYPLSFLADKKDLSRTLNILFSKHSIDFNKYITSTTKVMTMGKALYALTNGNTDIQVDAFYDYIFNDTKFYSPVINNYVWPTNTFVFFWGKDNFDNYFTKLQIKNMIKFEIKKFRKPKLNIVEVDDPNKFLNEYIDEKEVALDIETDGLNFTYNHIGCLTLSFNGITGYYLDFNKIDIEILDKFFINKFQIWANGKFDLKFLKYAGCKNAKIDFDTYNAGHCLNEMRSNSLKTHAWLYTQYGGYEKPLDDFKRKYIKVKNYLEIPKELLVEYATMDTIITFQVYKKMKDQMNWISETFYENEYNLNHYYYNIVIPSLNVFSEIEYEGMMIDWNKLDKIGTELQIDIEEIEDKIYKELKMNKNTINIHSNEQLAKILEEKGLPEHGRSKKDLYLVNDDTLNKWSKQGYKIAELILKLHELATLQKTFIGLKEKNTGFWQYKDKDNKIRSDFKVMLADSGRNRSGNPNLQNIPKHGDKAKYIRQIFAVPNEDYYFVEVDASGFQLRIGAILSQDIEMKKVFIELGGDMHSMTAQSVLKRDVILEEFINRKNEKEFKQVRFKAKAINFGFEFGSSGYAFARNVLENEWNEKEIEDYLINNNLVERPFQLLNNSKDLPFKVNIKFCKYWAVANDIRSKFFEKYNGLSKWIDDTNEYAKQNGYVKTPHGAIRRLPELLYRGNDSRRSHIKNLFNISLNSPVQNFEASLINSTIVYIYNYIKENNMKSKVIGTVHDSILFYIHKDELDIIKQKTKKYFEEDREINCGIPLEIEFNIADYYNNEVWGFGKETK